ncbi:MAG: polyprenol monophosphomannose synthase [Candidatus Micrarchaeota archaeon]|nr:polyprenol monophosphomannose synthase [Candidatus Micrarchaeota archaeon]
MSTLRKKRARRRGAPALTVLLPAYNEAGSLPPVIAGIREAMKRAGGPGRAYEILVVDDDSPDGTAAAARKCGARVMVRKSKRGLSSAIWDGLWAARADCVIVMDADGQHDANLIPIMAADLRAGRADVAVGSRYVRGGSGFEDPVRRLISAGAALMARPLTGELSDPMSGYFGVNRPRVGGGAGNGRPRAPGGPWHLRGFKFLPELLSRQPGLRVREYPLVFGKRLGGRSKMNAGEVAAYARLVLELYADRLMRRR